MNDFCYVNTCCSPATVCWLGDGGAQHGHYCDQHLPLGGTCATVRDHRPRPEEYVLKVEDGELRVEMNSYLDPVPSPTPALIPYMRGHADQLRIKARALQLLAEGHKANGNEVQRWWCAGRAVAYEAEASHLEMQAAHMDRKVEL